MQPMGLVPSRLLYYLEILKNTDGEMPFPIFVDWITKENEQSVFIWVLVAAAYFTET
jgi:hypothetical protein